MFLRPPAASGAIFAGNAKVTVPDPSGSLSWSNTQTSALTVQCWFKLSIPSGVALTENMTILVNRQSGTGAYAYHIYYDKDAAEVRFACSNSVPLPLISSPQPDRWYHVAVVRTFVTANSSQVTAYVDGQQLSWAPYTLGTGPAGGNGLSIGGWPGFGNGTYLLGEVQEVSVHQRALTAQQIVNGLFTDQLLGEQTLRGYFKMSFSQPTAERLINLAPQKTPGTDGQAMPPDALRYEETDRKGEQSSFDANRNGGSGAIAPLSGVFSWSKTALARPTPGLPLSFQIGYASGNKTAGALGIGWRHSFETRLVPSQYFSTFPDETVLGVLDWSGNLETWDQVGTNGVAYDYAPRRGEYRGELTRVGQTVTWVTPERLVYTFKSPYSSEPLSGRLLSIRDYNGNQIDPQYNTAAIGAPLTNVVDTAHGFWSLQYGGPLQQLTSVRFGDWRAIFEYDDQNRLISTTVTNTSASGLYGPVTNTTFRFAYYRSGNSSNLLQSIVDPMGRTNVVIAYDECGRKTNTVNALGQTTRFEYNVPQLRQLRTTDPENFRWVSTYDRNGRPIAQRDPLGNESHTTYDAAGNVKSTTDPRGNVTLFDHDEHGHLIAQTNALGEITRTTYDLDLNKPLTQTDPLGWTTTNSYDPAGNLLAQWDGLGGLATNTYTANGLLATQTDANGNTTTNLYNDDGFPIAQVDAAGFTNRFEVNELGWRLAAIDPLGEPTTYRYDINGNVVRTVDPLSRFYLATYDANGNRLTHTDAKGQVTTTIYDALNRKILEVDRAGATNWFAYTRRGKPAATTNAVGAFMVYQYDAANRETNAVDVFGNTSSKIYDANGNPIAIIDPFKQRWSRTYDRLNRKVAEADPFGSTVQTVFDHAGRTARTIDQEGAVTTLSYDGRGRMTNRVDAAGSRWSYVYDGVGNITCIIDAKGGRYLMVYDSRNKRIAETNQDNKEWHYTYDALGRLKTQTEPNGTVRTLEYDPGGRMDSVTFSPTSRENRFYYDANDNPVFLSRSDSGATTYLAYDEMDRVSQCTDPLMQTVRYGYDAAGRLTSIGYPGGKTLNNGYDVQDRLTSQVFGFDSQRSFTNTYAYDASGRLIHRTYPNSIAQDNTFDAAGQLTDLAHSPLNVGFHYAYDKSGNTTVRKERGTFQWPLPALREEVAAYTPANRLIDRQLTLNAQLSILNYHYDSNGNMTNAVGTDGQNWTLTYDEDNQTTSINWDDGLTSRHITNRYDAFGRRFAKVADGTQTGYVLDLAGKMEHILCDLDGSLAITAWYVHGPDLTFKIARDGSLTCFHPDGQGNIVALTGSSGTNLMQYAYSPYGRSLGSTNNTPLLASNPYLFVGSQGVMEEEGIPGLYFMRARYYLADAGIFLSTDPVQNIGPDWFPLAYLYGNCNPLRYNDPNGEVWNFIIGAVLGGGLDLLSQVFIEQKSLRQVNWARVIGSAAAGALTGGIGNSVRFAALTGGKALGASVGLGAMGGAVQKGAEIGVEKTVRGTGALANMIYGPHVNWSAGSKDYSGLGALKAIGMSAAGGAVKGGLGRLGKVQWKATGVPGLARQDAFASRKILSSAVHSTTFVGAMKQVPLRAIKEATFKASKSAYREYIDPYLPDDLSDVMEGF